MKWTARSASLLLLIIAPTPLRAQAADPAWAPFDCPMPIVAPGSGGRTTLEPPPAVPPRQRTPPAPPRVRILEGSVPESEAGRAVPMPTLRTRCFNPLAMKFEPPIDTRLELRPSPKFFDLPDRRDPLLEPEGVDRFRLDEFMGLTPPRGE